MIMETLKKKLNIQAEKIDKKKKMAQRHVNRINKIFDLDN